MRLSPERLYVSTLALSGVAAVMSLALAPAQRGSLSACMASATMGSAIGGFSIDTFLLSRPHGWVFGRGRWWLITLAVGSTVLSAGVAAVLVALAGVGSYVVALGAAAALTAFNSLSSLALRLKKFMFVYSVRAAGAGVLIAGYAALYAAHRRTGGQWSTVYLLSQVAAAAGISIGVLRMARRLGIAARAGGATTGDDITSDDITGGGTDVPAEAPARYGKDLADLGKLHVGACSQTLTYRLDQILLARFAGPGPLGVYALAVAALEFAQAGAVVAAQRILADRTPARGLPRIAPVLRTAIALAVFSVAALVGLGLLLPSYHESWLAGLLLLPGCLAVSVGKTWSASLLKRRGERATSTVAVVTLSVAALCYLVLVPTVGMLGAAVASSIAYVVYAVTTRLSLRQPPTVAPVTGSDHTPADQGRSLVAPHAGPHRNENSA